MVFPVFMCVLANVEYKDENRSGVRRGQLSSVPVCARAFNNQLSLGPGWSNDRPRA